MAKAKKELPAFMQKMMKNKEVAPIKGEKGKKKPKSKKKGY